MNEAGRWRRKKLQKLAKLVEEFRAELERVRGPVSNNQGEEANRPFVAPPPPFRKLRGYSVDPSLSTDLSSVAFSDVTYQLPWEKLKPGPIGEYLEVVDVDPSSGCYYEPVDLNDPALLAQDGLPPSESTPQFHQQMVYAVCTLTINNFERALGRRALWRPGPSRDLENSKDDSHYVQRLRIYPHALREANAFYSPQKIALLFGYFRAPISDEELSDSTVFTCLSHDIVAHETTHALLDGMHREFLLPSNRDVLAFHEGFADCVAMLQHFTFPKLLAYQISSTRGDIDSRANLLVQLASQFGKSLGNRTALRDAIGILTNKGTPEEKWVRREPLTSDYAESNEPHEHGKVLVAAVFDAFLSIYRRRTADLRRLASNGSGILRQGAIHPDLVNRLSEEASKSAQHVLNMCIRALDYCPPTDITFGEYLRAIITADHDLVPNDDLNYRVSFVQAFRKRGIYPKDLRTLSVENLIWRTLEEGDLTPSNDLCEYLTRLRDPQSAHIYAETREEVFRLQRKMRAELHQWLSDHFKTSVYRQRDADFLGIDHERPFEVHSVRIAYRTSPDGGVSPQLLIGILQLTTVLVDSASTTGPRMVFEGGCSLVVDLRARKVQYCIRKDVQSTSRLQQQQQFALEEFNTVRSTYLDVRSLSDNAALRGNEPFALIHRGC